MKLCIWHEPLDVDVSSGTDHARYQWHELANAFGITEVYVVNTTDSKFNSVNRSVSFLEISSLDEINESLIAIEQGEYPNHRDHRFPEDCCIVIGGAMGVLGLNADYYTIPTPVALYPREAAAIVLENQWQLRL